MKGKPLLICHRPWSSTFIRLDGGVTFCCHLPRPEAVIGNLREEPFEAVWDSPLARSMRDCFLHGHLPPHCRGCPLVEVQERAARATRWRPFGGGASGHAGDHDEEPMLAGEETLFHLGRGWWNPEVSDERTTRWTRSQAEIYVNRMLLGLAARRARESLALSEHSLDAWVAVDLRSSRSDDEPTTRVRVSWEGEEGRIRALPANMESSMAIPVPARLAAESEEGADETPSSGEDSCPSLLLTLTVENPWIPARSVEGSSDERELGMMVSGLRLVVPPRDGKPSVDEPSGAGKDVKQRAGSTTSRRGFLQDVLNRFKRR